MKNTDKPKKKVCILLSFCYASTYSITFTVTVDFFNLLGYAIIFFSTQRSQSKKCHLHFLHTKHCGLT